MTLGIIPMFKYFATLIVLSIVFASSTVAFAGGNGGSYSRVSGVFFGDDLGAVVDFENPDHVLALERVCEGKGRIWAFGLAKPFRCIEFGLDKSYGRNTAYVGFKTSSDKQEPDGPYLLSIRPFYPTKWTIRSVTPEEQSELISLLGGKSQQYKSALRSITAGRAKAIQSKDLKTIYFLIPARIIIVEHMEAVDRNHFHLVVIKSKQRLRVSGEIDNPPYGFVDLDGDGMPEMVTDPGSSEGTSRNVWDVKGKAKIIVSLSEY